MRKLLGITVLTCALLLLVSTFAPHTYAAMFKISGGPSGGTFQYYASAISTLAKKHKMKVLASSSAGSIENIRLTNSGKSGFALAYSGHVFQARNGKLPGDDRKYEDVLALGYFYSAPAQLIVRAGSDIQAAKQLDGKRVGVGNAGSGAAANCELFFREVGIWETIERNFLGYRQAADAFKNNQLDAFWVFAGFPNASVLEAALQTDVRLLNLYKEAEGVGMFEKYPYFAKVTIPGGTYKGQDEDVTTFQESCLWVANSKVPEDVVYNLLKAVYSKEGLEYMVSVHKSAKAMSVEGGLQGIVRDDGKVINPLHPGAEKFWKEMGVLK
jgi:hypothetical protein